MSKVLAKCGATTAISASTTSQGSANNLGAAGANDANAVHAVNLSSAIAYVHLDASAVDATVANSMPVPPNGSLLIAKGANDTTATVILSTGTGTVTVTPVMARL